MTKSNHIPQSRRLSDIIRKAYDLACMFANHLLFGAWRKGDDEFVDVVIPVSFNSEEDAKEMGKSMTGKQSSESTQTEAPSQSKRIKNTFAPTFANEYFEPATLFAACKYGLSPDVLPPKAKKMLKEYQIEYNKRCSKPGDKVVFPELPADLLAKIINGPEGPRPGTLS